ncbi:hypothetical protein F5Y13DRAFT_197754 [Hypoxylon sp. FL1857]|nr:hypothetical protein F5Y13DRAFT_197754 [Hypoxylon sp. FL1857]
MSEMDRLLEEYEMMPPPPYSLGHQSLKPWQRRWNKDWFDAWAKNLRMLIPSFERNRRRNGISDEDLITIRAHTEAWISDAIRQGATDKSNAFSRSRWRCIKERFFWRLQDEYDSFKQWRRDRKERGKLYKVTAAMEDVGDNPKWKAEMTFKISRENWVEMVNTGQWFEFPSAENIKWFWVNGVARRDVLLPRAAHHWGPDPNFLWGVVVLPFCEDQGRVIRNHQVRAPLDSYWHNFVEPTRRTSSAASVAG